MKSESKLTSWSDFINFCLAYEKIKPKQPTVKGNTKNSATRFRSFLNNELGVSDIL